jgi:hypothetical protein
LTLRDLGSDLPGAIRLRHVLKSLLRGWRFRCVRIEPEDALGAVSDDRGSESEKAGQFVADPPEVEDHPAPEGTTAL